MQEASTLLADRPAAAADILQRQTTANVVPASEPPRRLSVAEFAIQSGATVAELRQILELQVQADNHSLAMLQERRRMEKEDREEAQMLAFRKAFAAFRGKNIVVPKTKLVNRAGAGSFWQAEYGVAAELLSPALSECGFSFRHDMVFGSKRWMTDGVESDIAWVYVTCYLEHEAGHAERLNLEGPPGDLGGNTPIQNMQATGSFLKRQSLLAITGTATQDEDDETKLRKREVAGAEAEKQGELQAIRATGDQRAELGMQHLTAWWGGLSAKQRGALNGDFSKWRKTAQQHDARSKT